MRKSIITVVVTLVFSGWGTLADADIYKFVDEDGTVHFTNTSHQQGYKKVIAEKRKRGEKNFDHIIINKSRKYDIDPSLIKALITAESNWDPKAVSNKGAIGLMQLMPETAKDMEISNPYDPEQNIEAGTRYLRLLLDRFGGDPNLALAAYNAGPARVEKSGGIPSIRETEDFVEKVITLNNGGSLKKPVRIRRIVLDDGTILFTNTSSKPR